MDGIKLDRLFLFLTSGTTRTLKDVLSPFMRMSRSTSTPTTVTVLWSEARLLGATIISLCATLYAWLHVMLALRNLDDISMVINLFLFLELARTFSCDTVGTIVSQIVSLKIISTESFLFALLKCSKFFRVQNLVKTY